MDPDGLRLRGNRMCINIYSPPFTFFPTKTGERKSASPGTHLYASHRTGAYSLMPRRVHVWGLLWSHVLEINMSYSERAPSYLYSL